MIFFRALLNSIADVFISCTIENREVSSANSSALDDKPSGKSLNRLEKSNGPKIDPWETPALTLVHEED